MKRFLSLLCVCVLFFYYPAFCQQDKTEVKLFKITNGNAESFRDVVDSLLSGEGRVSVDKNTNTIIVVDKPYYLKRIAEVLGGLDVERKQVRIKVMVADVSSSFLNQIGVTKAQAVIPLSKSSAVFNLLSGSRDSNVLYQTMVMTLSGEPAHVEFSKDHIVSEQIVTHPDGTVVKEFIMNPVGQFLEVLPRANNNGTITLSVKPTVSSVKDADTIAENTLSTQVTVTSGDTLVIGGLSTQKKDSAVNSLPLSGLPLSREETSDRRETVTFISASILE